LSDDDMSFMREVFMPDTQGNEKPKLPFAQYIVEWGLHPLSERTGEATGERWKRLYGDSFQAVYKLPRPNGTQTKVSVISGGLFYSRIGEPYEVMVCHETDMDSTDNLHPYQTDEDLMLLLAKLLGEDNGLSK